VSLTLPARAHHDKGWFSAQLAQEIDHGRFAFFLPALTVAGIFAWAALPFDPPLPALGALLVALIAVRLAAARIGATVALAPIALALAAFVAGALAIGLESRFAGTPVVARATTAEITGRVLSVERREGRSTRVVLAPTESDLTGPVPRRVRLAVRTGPPLAVGDTVSVKARLFPLRGPAIPGGYDPGRRLYFDGIGATGFAYGAPEVITPSEGGPASRLAHLRRTIADTILDSGMPSAPFAIALLVGERGLMAESDVEALRISGLGHILAISGLHMALFAGAVFATLRFALALVPRVALTYPIKKWAAVAGILAATAYLALSGASVATVRAYVMLLIGVTAILADRLVLTMRTVAIAAAVLIVLDPVSVMEPGFQMSFLAVVALVGTYEWWAGRRGRLTRGRPVTAFIVGLAVTSLVAGLATTPIGAYHFQRVAPLGLLANLLTMPIFSLIAMPAGALALFLMPFGLAALPLAVMGGALDLITLLAHTVAGWTGTAGLVGTIPALSAALAATGIIVLCVLTATWRLAGAGLIALSLCLLPFAKPPDLFVSDDARSIAARGPDGRLTLSPRTSDYVGEVFLRADADPRPPDDAKTGRCDPSGCTLPLQDGFLAIPSSRRAAPEDCRRASVIVSYDDLSCPRALVLDKALLAEHGSLTARQEDGIWQIEFARPYGVVRPWQVPSDIRRN